MSREDLEEAFWDDRPLLGRSLIEDEFENYKREIDLAFEEGELSITSGELFQRIREKSRDI